MFVYFNVAWEQKLSEDILHPHACFLKKTNNSIIWRHLFTQGMKIFVLPEHLLLAGLSVNLIQLKNSNRIVWREQDLLCRFVPLGLLHSKHYFVKIHFDLPHKSTNKFLIIKMNILYRALLQLFVFVSLVGLFLFSCNKVSFAKRRTYWFQSHWRNAGELRKEFCFKVGQTTELNDGEGLIQD